MVEQANELRLSYPWLQAKLFALDVGPLQQSFVSSHMTESCQVVGRTLTRSAHVLRADKREFTLQIFGRLGYLRNDRAIERLVAAAMSQPTISLKPRWPHLVPLGPELLVLEGHEAWVNSVSFNHDGTKIVTGSNDKTARIWDAETGKELEAIRFDSSVRAIDAFKDCFVVGLSSSNCIVVDFDC